MDAKRARQKTEARRSNREAIIWAALVFVSGLYLFHFFEGGREKLINDSLAYLQLSNGEAVGVPYNLRVLKPLLARLLALLTGLSTWEAFQILTPIEVLLSLLLIGALLRNRGASPGWQAAVMLALGSSLAVTFGYTPVMVDTLILLLTCMVIAALDRNRLVLAFILVILAALTKEYAVFLSLVWGLHAYRLGHRRFALIGALVPLMALLTLFLVMRPALTAGFEGWRAFLDAMFGYHLSLLNFRGTRDYLKILYMWSWSMLWPLLLVSVLMVARSVRRLSTLNQDQIDFLIMLVAVPILLLADWGRAFLLIVPFACIAATGNRLAKEEGFATLLAVGGVATALARPVHGSISPPQLFFISMAAVSTIASLLIAFKIIRGWPAAVTPLHD